MEWNLSQSFSFFTTFKDKRAVTGPVMSSTSACDIHSLLVRREDQNLLVNLFHAPTPVSLNEAKDVVFQVTNPLQFRWTLCYPPQHPWNVGLLSFCGQSNGCVLHPVPSPMKFNNRSLFAELHFKHKIAARGGVFLLALHTAERSLKKEIWSL